jgi:hypothetical protein
LALKHKRCFEVEKTPLKNSEETWQFFKKQNIFAHFLLFYLLKKYEKIQQTTFTATGLAKTKKYDLIHRAEDTL